MFTYDYDNKSQFNVNCDVSQINRLRQRYSVDYESAAFSLAGPKTCNNVPVSRHHSIPSSPQHINNDSVSGSTIPKSMILIRRQSSDKCLQKRHSVDSNNSDPGYSSTNNKIFLSPSQQRDCHSPKSCHSSVASVTGRNSSYSSMAFLSRQSSTNSSKLPTQQEDDSLHYNKWFSSSSVILTRVKSMKEKIRRVVVQSVQPDDWPPPSVLFSDRYRCPSSAISSRTPLRYNSHLVKSQSIDHSSFSTFTGRKVPKTPSPAGSGRYFKPKILQRSMTTYTDSMDHGNCADNGIVCSDMDLKAIINSFKKEGTAFSLRKYNSNTTDDANTSNQNVSTVIGPGFGKRKLMRKQVSFDDEQGVMMINRKVSAIAEEIEYHTSFEKQPSLSGSSLKEATPLGDDEPADESDLIYIKDIPCSDEEDNFVTGADSFMCLLPKDVEFDEYGQTWEVYGADPDPEILGQAIQNHLEILMTCRQNRNLPNGNAPITKEDIVDEQQTNIREKRFKSLRVDLQTTENNLRFLARRLCGKWSCFSVNHQRHGDKVMVSIDNSY